ncbi:DsbA family protein [Microbacterium gallinarum]|uniref:Thioredoxin domain-containing protein n=1 Tax=Microbacterium gallinarum TaxID=2762209 RepID=A0ABR8X1Z8_9MICO|nr:thioredoxin domain-containing protein [Microbacterium gallinarum]MBD8023360.1 thioredoxin domain-containing protein [Microbacterium gallinarum]
MSSDESSNAAAPSERRDAVREKAQQVQARQSRARLIRVATISAVAVAVVAVAALVVTWAVSSAASKPMLSPQNVSNGGFVVTGVTGAGLATEEDQNKAGTIEGTATPTPTPTATPTPTPTPTPTEQPAADIRVYVDYLSAGSRDFQLANVQQLSKWVSEDAATLTYYPVAMLTSKSNGTKYSLRAAGAAACVATHSPDYFFAFNNTLLTQQPEVDSDGYTDSELAAMAIASGADGAKVVRACIEEQDFTSWAKTATERALGGLPGTDDLALTGTPMVLVNGTPYVGALDDPKEFAQFVLTVASDAGDETPTPTPTPTP